ncbi:hypothetical protein Salat_1894100 [Sesamum alatum]|uniref:Uncharacterized protein n=1 Tax=Sesamum alatum TaxID=300844 RepID=A0AAE1Y3K5_9LAMI|nr:hypothetical protein Salat_1894100 [Sesamum alatum]
MAEGYIAEGCLTFYSVYLNDIESQFNKVECNYEKFSGSSQHTLSVFSENSRLIGKGVYDFLDEKSLKQVHVYVLKNSDEVLPYIRNDIPATTVNLDEVTPVEDHVEAFIDDQDEEEDSTLAEYDDEEEENNLDENQDDYDFD